jgi:hypothetical protein
LLRNIGKLSTLHHIPEDCLFIAPSHEKLKKKSSVQHPKLETLRIKTAMPLCSFCLHFDLKMEVVRTSDMSTNFCQPTWYQIPGDNTLRNHAMRTSYLTQSVHIC